MKVSQLIYTSCANNNNPLASGYMIYGKSVGISDQEASEIQKTMNFKLRPEYPFDADWNTISQTFPKNLAFFKLSSGKLCLAQSSYIGLDCAGTRYGNYIIHAFVAERFEEIDPYSFVNSSQFRTRLTDEEIKGEVPGVLPEIEIHDEASDEITHFPYMNKLFFGFIALMESNEVSDNDKVFVRVQRENIGAFLRMYSKISNNKSISFSTYLNNKFEYRNKVNVLFEDVDVSNSASSIMGTFKVYYFDFISEKTNYSYELNSYEKLFVKKFNENPKGAFRFRAEVASNVIRYNLPNSTTGVIVDLLKSGNLGKENAYLKVYSEHIKSYHDKEIANKIYEVNKEKLNNAIIKEIFDDIDSSYKLEISKRVAYETIESNSSRFNEIKRVLSDIDVIPYQYVIEGLKNLSIAELINGSSEKALCAFVAYSLISPSENDLITLAKKVATDSRIFRDFHIIFKDNYRVADYPTLANFIYEKSAEIGVNKNILITLYPALSQELKDDLIKSNFQESGRFNSIDKIESFINSVQIDRNEIIKVMTSASVLNAMIQRFDFISVLAILDYRGFDENLVSKLISHIPLSEDEKRRNELLALVPTLRKDVYREYLYSLVYQRLEVFFTTSPNNLLTGLEFYRNYKDKQESLILLAIDKERIDLDEANALVSRFNIPLNGRIRLLKEICDNRNDPSYAYEIASRNANDQIARSYLKKNFSKDLVDKVAKATSINDCESILYKYKDSLLHDQLQSIINKIFTFEIAKIYGNLGNKGIEDLSNLIKEKGISRPQKLNEVIIYKTLLLSARGETELVIDSRDLRIAYSDELIRLIPSLTIRYLAICRGNSRPIYPLLEKIMDSEIFYEEIIKLLKENKNYSSLILYIYRDKFASPSVKEVAIKIYGKYLERDKNGVRIKKAKEIGLTDEELEEINTHMNYKYGLIYKLFFMKKGDKKDEEKDWA